MIHRRCIHVYMNMNSSSKVYFNVFFLKRLELLTLFLHKQENLHLDPQHLCKESSVEQGGGGERERGRRKRRETEREHPP